ncbi:MAG: serine hydrolase domain-containing protein, partial [Cyclobacteriaceae bacterium]
MSRFSLFFYFMLLLSCQPSQLVDHKNEVPNDGSIASEKFSAELRELQQFFRIPGISVAVVADSAVIHTDYIGYASLADSLPVTGETVFPIASVTKVFSAVLLMQLAEQGLLRLDDPVNKYLVDSPVGDSITVGHILSHT